MKSYKHSGKLELDDVIAMYWNICVFVYKKVNEPMKLPRFINLRTLSLCTNILGANIPKAMLLILLII